MRKREAFAVGAVLLAAAVALEPALAAGKGTGPTSADLTRMLGIAAAVIAIVGLFLVEFVLRPRIGRGTYYWIMLVGLLILPSFAMVGSATTVLNETKKVESCKTCHIMEPFVDDMQDPHSSSLAARHFKNNWIAESQCYACHTNYGAHGTFESKRDGFRHWLLYVTHTWDEPIQYSGSYPNNVCMSCHGGTPKFEAVPSHFALGESLKSDRTSCVTCHGPPHPTPNERHAVKSVPLGGKVDAH